jgi:AmmeMemoRadiSam system protein A
MLLEPDDQQRLLRLARRSLEAYVRREPRPLIDRTGALGRPCGAFMTLTRFGDLRGCLGRIEAIDCLAETIAHLSAAVADSDPRFDPVGVHELPEIAIELSILTPESEVAAVDEIEVGRHGLIIEQGRRRGLLLPQVAIEYGWDVRTFLSHTCHKAGLPTDAWSRGARIFRFEAQVFGEAKGRERSSSGCTTMPA